MVLPLVSGLKGARIALVAVSVALTLGAAIGADVVGSFFASPAAAAPLAGAQAPAQAPGAQAPAQKPDAQAPPTIRVDVDVVNLFVTVKDKKGKLINTLNKDDFEVFEDGQRQQVRYFSRESDLPLTLGLLVDTSVSQGRLVPAERDASETFFRRVLGKKDMAFVIGFDTDVDLLQDFTDNQRLLTDSLDKLRVNSSGPPTPIPSAQGPFPGIQRGGTHLYDAIYLAATDKLRTEVGRKAIIVITDGEDQGSKLKIQDAIEAAQKADAIIYGVLFVDRAFYGGFGMGYSGEGVLKKMSEETGGRMVEVKRNQGLAAAFEEIAQELRSQYNIGYSPTRARQLGGFRRLRIKTVREDLKVQARNGYYATSEAQ